MKNQIFLALSLTALLSLLALAVLVGGLAYGDAVPGTRLTCTMAGEVVFDHPAERVLHAPFVTLARIDGVVVLVQAAEGEVCE